MGGIGGLVQLAELGVRLNDTLIDSGGQVEGGVNLQEEDVGQRRAVKSNHTERRQREKQSQI